MEISVRQIGIKSKYIRTLLSNGIILISHLNKFDARKLAQKTRLSHDECEEVLAAIKPRRPSHKVKISELMIDPFDKISTLIEDIDNTLGGGLRSGQIVEISGEAGAGKSNLCAEIGVSVMLPESKQGVLGNCLDSNVLLIHTEGEGKLKLTVKRFSTLAASEDCEQLIQRRLHVFNCSNEFELAEIVNRLPELLDKHKPVKLVIIDSMTCAFISSESNPNYTFYLKRSQRLTRLVKSLARIAWDMRLLIMVTNHVSYNQKLGETKPAMGRLWSHMCQTKIYLERKNTNLGEVVRYAQVTKGATNSPSIAQFRISDRIQS